jgi:hypothetical protein
VALEATPLVKEVKSEMPNWGETSDQGWFRGQAFNKRAWAQEYMTRGDHYVTETYPDGYRHSHDDEDDDEYTTVRAHKRRKRPKKKR